jgi:hypothetical protein
MADQVIEPGELVLRAGSGLSVKRPDIYDDLGRRLAQQQARPKTDKVDTVLKDRFPPDGHPPPPDQMGNTELHLAVCDHAREHWSRLFPNISFHPKELPSIESVLRSDLVGRKKRR